MLGIPDTMRDWSLKYKLYVHLVKRHRDSIQANTNNLRIYTDTDYKILKISLHHSGVTQFRISVP